MNVSVLVWAVTCAVILGLFVFDFFAHVRVAHEPTFRESAVWSSFYIGLAVAFATGSSTFGHDNVGLNLRLLAAGPITAIPLALFGVAAPRLTLVTVGILQYITPMAQFFLGWWVFHEEMPPERLAGFALVWLALVILTADAVATIRRNRSVRPDAAATSARGEGRAPARR